MTPFEEAGYTKDAKFKVLVSDGAFTIGDIVTLEEDDGTTCPWFISECGKFRAFFALPEVDSDNNEIEPYNMYDSGLKATQYYKSDYDKDLIKSKMAEIRELLEFIEISIGEGK